MTSARLIWAAALLPALAAAGCGGRPDIWSQAPQGVTAYGLAGSVALIDPPANRVVMLTASGSNDDLGVTRVRTGHGIVASAVQPDGHRLFVLTAGHRAVLGDTQPDERPGLTVIDDGGAVEDPIDLGLTDALEALAVDPAGHWVVVYQDGGTSSSTLVANPNEIVIVDLDAGRAVRQTLHSFGGRPQRLFFTPPLGLPGATQPQPMLIVQSDQDLALLPLSSPQVGLAPEITVRLNDPAATRRLQPADVVVDDGDPARTDDARIGIRFTADTSVMTLQLEPSPDGPGLAPTVNVADVGGVPGDIAFVRTDGGLRLAALVPSASKAVLVDPVTTITTDVALPAPYARMSLVTEPSTGGGAITDVALLWSGDRSAAGIAFWELGQAAGRPFRSIETVGVTAAVRAVLDVPRTDAALKVLQTGDVSSFYVLDLLSRTAAPLVTATSSVSLSVSPTGARVWTFAAGQKFLASTDLTTKAVRNLQADSPIDGVFEIARSDGSGRALVALHTAGGVGATVFDVATQDDTRRRIYGALLTEGPYEDR